MGSLHQKHRGLLLLSPLSHHFQIRTSFHLRQMPFDVVSFCVVCWSHRGSVNNEMCDKAQALTDEDGLTIQMSLHSANISKKVWSFFSSLCFVWRVRFTLSAAGSYLVSWWVLVQSHSFHLWRNRSLKFLEQWEAKALCAVVTRGNVTMGVSLIIQGSERKVV